jgi:hypothetical protein
LRLGFGEDAEPWMVRKVLGGQGRKKVGVWMERGVEGVVEVGWWRLEFRPIGVGSWSQAATS